MLRYFPNLLPDEMLYSVFCRYAKKTGADAFRPLVKEIFGEENIISTWEFPSHIVQLIRNLDSGQCYTSDEIIFNHTMLPLYYPFLDRERQQYAFKHMRGDNGKGLHMKLGVMASSVKGLNSLRYCPQCISEDIAEHGVAYWHRSHNASGVTVCHKHGVRLMEKCPVCDIVIAPKTKNAFFTLEDKCPKGHALISSNPDCSQKHRMELRLAKTVNYLLNTHLKNHNLTRIHKIYLNSFHEKNLITPKGTVSQAEIVEQFRLFYGDNFLEQLGLGIETDSWNCWVANLIRRPDRASHPLKHILLINFLAEDMFIFFRKTQREYHPFGKGPWLCLNPVTDHYKQPVVGLSTLN